jgi:hypothetical protein
LKILKRISNVLLRNKKRKEKRNVFEWLLYCIYIVGCGVIYMFFKDSIVIVIKEYVISILIAIATMDAMFFAMWMPLYWERINKIKDFWGNEKIVDSIVDTFGKLDKYVFWIVLHLCITLLIIFACKGFDSCVLCLVTAIFLIIFSFFRLIFLLCSRINEIGIYEHFDTIKINNKKINDLRENKFSDINSFNNIVELLRILIIVKARKNPVHDSVARHLNALVGMYIYIQRHLHLKNYKELFYIAEENAKGHKAILKTLLWIYEDTLSNSLINDIYILNCITNYFVNILLCSYNQYLSDNENKDLFSATLYYLIRVAKKNISFYDKTISLDKDFLFEDSIDWFCVVINKEFDGNDLCKKRKKCFVDNPVILNEFKKISVKEILGLCYFAIDENQRSFFKFFVKHLYKNKGNLSKNRKIIQTMFSAVISYAVFANNYDAVSEFLLNVKVNNRKTNSVIELIPVRIGDIYRTFIDCYDDDFRKIISYPDNVDNCLYLQQTFVLFVIIAVWTDKEYKPLFNNSSLKYSEIDISVDDAIKQTHPNKLFNNILSDKNEIMKVINDVVANKKLLKTIVNDNESIPDDVAKKVRKIISELMQKIEHEKNEQLKTPIDIEAAEQKLLRAYFEKMSCMSQGYTSLKGEPRNIAVDILKQRFITKDNFGITETEINFSFVVLDFLVSQISDLLAITKADDFENIVGSYEWIVFIVDMNFRQSISSKMSVKTNTSNICFVEIKLENLENSKAVFVKKNDFVKIEVNENIEKKNVRIEMKLDDKKKFINGEDYFVVDFSDVKLK